MEETIDKKKKKGGKDGGVSPSVIRRLPRYHRLLGELLRKNCLRVSSAALSEMLDVTASQIRQDLNCFGGFGQQGYGYNVKNLYEKIGSLLGVQEEYTAIVLGAGNLGKALVNSRMFERRGVKRLAMFDVDPAVIGQTIAGLTVYDMKDLAAFCKENRVDIGVLTTPKDAAQSVAKQLADAGVAGIWNFSNMEISLPQGVGVCVENIHLGDSLMQLCYAIKAKKGDFAL